MKLNFNINLPKMSYGRTKNQAILDEFMQSGKTSARVEDYPHRNAKSCYSCLSRSAQLYYRGSIRVVMRKGGVNNGKGRVTTALSFFAYFARHFMKGGESFEEI